MEHDGRSLKQSELAASLILDRMLLEFLFSTAVTSPLHVLFLFLCSRSLQIQSSIRSASISDVSTLCFIYVCPDIVAVARFLHSMNCEAKSLAEFISCYCFTRGS